MRLLYGGSGWLPVVELMRARLPGHSVEIWDRTRPLAEVIGEVDVLLPSNAVVDGPVIAAAHRLRLIQQPAAGVDGIDRAAARARGIPVCNAPGTNDQSVAECCALLLLSLARRLPLAQRAFETARIGEPVGTELRGKTIGIIGYGRTGRAFAELASQGLGMRVLWHSRSAGHPLREILRESDVISLHLPLTPETTGLIGAAELAAMKPGAWVLNAARGPILDRVALESALDRGHIGGVGLDVFWEEPWSPTDPLLCRTDVVTLPHMAGSTHEAFCRVADIVAENVSRLMTGQGLLHVVSEV